MKSENVDRYRIIYKIKNLKMELSIDKKLLKTTLTKDGEKEVHHYKNVSEPKGIGAIEDRSVNWKLMDPRFDKKKNYYIIIQLDAENKPTNNIKIVSRDKCDVRGILNLSVTAKPKDFLYYVKK